MNESKVRPNDQMLDQQSRSPINKKTKWHTDEHIKKKRSNSRTKDQKLDKNI